VQPPKNLTRVEMFVRVKHSSLLRCTKNCDSKRFYVIVPGYLCFWGACVVGVCFTWSVRFFCTMVGQYDLSCIDTAVFTLRFCIAFFSLKVMHVGKNINSI
jgi:hypothetical protein